MDTEEESRRILKVAQDLFHREGITATGVQRISTAAGISKRTLYERFDSKDHLLELVLRGLDMQVYAGFVGQAETAGADPVARLDALFAGAERRAGQDGFRGCPFINFAAEIPGPAHPAREIIKAHKERMRGWIEQQLRTADARDPIGLSRELAVLFDGALATSGITGDVGPAKAARNLAAARVREALPGGPGTSVGSPSPRRTAGSTPS